MFWLANKLDMFARGLHSHVSLFILYFLSAFELDTPWNIIPIFFSPKKDGKFNDSSGDEKDYSNELRNFELKYFAVPYLLI